MAHALRLTNLTKRADQVVGHILLNFDAEHRLLDEDRRLEVREWHGERVRTGSIARNHIDLRRRSGRQWQEGLLELGSGVHLQQSTTTEWTGAAWRGLQ